MDHNCIPATKTQNTFKGYCCDHWVGVGSNNTTMSIVEQLLQRKQNKRKFKFYIRNQFGQTHDNLK
jgi:hypothetical protein